MKFAIVGIAMVLLFVVFHFLFIMIDYGYNNPDSGAFSLIDDKLQPYMDKAPSEYKNKPAELLQFFGLGRFVILAMILVCFAAEAFTRSKVEG